MSHPYTLQSSDQPQSRRMMYSALNLRPVLAANDECDDSYWYLAIGFFNGRCTRDYLSELALMLAHKVVLPTFIPKSDHDIEKIFWRRARAAKEQTAQAAKSPMLASRCLEMARKRGTQARRLAREDDEKERGTCRASTPPPRAKDVTRRPPCAALVGLSLLGNLDAIYNHAAFPKVEVHTLTTGSRQRAGGILLFGYTFAGKCDCPT